MVQRMGTLNAQLGELETRTQEAQPGLGVDNMLADMRKWFNDVTATIPDTHKALEELREEHSLLRKKLEVSEVEFRNYRHNAETRLETLVREHLERLLEEAANPTPPVQPEAGGASPSALLPQSVNENSQAETIDPQLLHSG